MIWKHHYAEMKTTNSLLFENSEVKKKWRTLIALLLPFRYVLLCINNFRLEWNQRKHSTFQDDVNPSNKKKFQVINCLVLRFTCWSDYWSISDGLLWSLSSIKLIVSFLLFFPLLNELHPWLGLIYIIISHSSSFFFLPTTYLE